MKITWGSKRDLKKYDISIEQYYKNLGDHWNDLSDFISDPTDRRTKYYRAYHQFFMELVYMSDMIIQNQKQHEALINKKNEQIQALERELEKWTEQQHGRKSKLTEHEKEHIKNWKKSGASNREIANKIGVSEGTIRNVLR